MDAERFDGLARTFADREVERDRDREQFAALTRLAKAKGSRRVALAGVLTTGLLGQGFQATSARCHSREGKDKRQCRRRARKDQAPGSGDLFPCQEKLFGLCTVSPTGNAECCNSMDCVGTLAPFVTACQYLCDTDFDCKNKFPHKALACREDALVCPLRGKCCVPR